MTPMMLAAGYLILVIGVSHLAFARWRKNGQRYAPPGEWLAVGLLIYSAIPVFIACLIWAIL